MEPISMAISGGISLISGLFGAGRARRAARKAQRESAALQRRITGIENNNGLWTNTVVMRSSSGTVRWIKSHHTNKEKFNL